MRQVFKLIGVFLFLIFLWVVLNVNRSLLSEPNHSCLDYIPNDADKIIYFNGHAVLQEAVSTVVLKYSDQSFIDKVLELLDDEGKSRKLGIDFDSDMILFEQSIKEKPILGIIVNLNDRELFEEHFKDAQHIHRLIFNNDDVAIFLTTDKINLQGCDLESVDYLAVRPTSFKEKIQETSDAHLLFWQKNKNNDYDVMELRLDDRKVHMIGEVDSRIHQQEGDITCLKPGGFHLSSQFVPDFLNDSIQSVFTDTFPKLTALSVNHYGLELINPLSMQVVPNADMLFTFETPIQLISILENLEKDEVVSEIKADRFTYLKHILYYHQIDNHQFYLGEHPFDENQLVQSNAAFESSGDLSLITEVEASGLVLKILNIIPMYASSKKLTEHIEYFDVKSNGTTITGELKFKDGHYPINAMFYWLLETEIIQ